MTFHGEAWGIALKTGESRGLCRVHRRSTDPPIPCAPLWSTPPNTGYQAGAFSQKIGRSFSGESDQPNRTDLKTQIPGVHQGHDRGTALYSDDHSRKPHTWAWSHWSALESPTLTWEQQLRTTAFLIKYLAHRDQAIPTKQRNLEERT